MKSDPSPGAAWRLPWAVSHSEGPSPFPGPPLPQSPIKGLAYRFGNNSSLSWFPPTFLCLNAGAREVFGQLDSELERTSHYEDRLNPAHSCGRRDGFGGANRAFAQTMGGPLLKSKSVNCRAWLLWSLLKCLRRPEKVERDLISLNRRPFSAGAQAGCCSFRRQHWSNRFAPLFLQGSLLVLWNTFNKVF